MIKKNSLIAKHLEYLEFEEEAKDKLQQMLKTKHIDIEQDEELKLALTRLMMATHLRMKIQGK